MTDVTRQSGRRVVGCVVEWVEDAGDAGLRQRASVGGITDRSHDRAAVVHCRIQELANQHGTLRQMLGHGDWDDKTEYKLQTLKDNLRLFTPELLDRINQGVVRAGQVLVKKKGPRRGSRRAG